MSLVTYKIIGAVLIFLVSMAAVIYPLKRKHTAWHAEPLELGEAFASGVFLGAAFFHMLPDAIKLFAEALPAITFPLPELVCVGGFLFLLLLERLSLAQTSTRSIPYILAIILIVHALTEGAALGIGSHFSEALMIFIAILAHKGSESFALCMMLLRHELPLKRVIAIILFFSFMTPLGIFLGTWVNAFTIGTKGMLTAGLFNAFAAGTFLYISTLHHIHFHKHTTEARGLIEFACLVVGVAIMGGIAMWV